VLAGETADVIFAAPMNADDGDAELFVGIAFLDRLHIFGGAGFVVTRFA